MFGRGWVGARVLVYDLYLVYSSIFVAFVRVVSILCVWVLCPYAWVKVVFRCCGCVSHLFVLVILSLLLGIRVGCI